MSNYSTLKAAISAVIKENNNHEITGQVLQTTLLAMVDRLAGGYLFKGVATPSTVVGTPDENVFYIGGAGTYSNFGATPVQVPLGGFGIFTYNGSFTNYVLPSGGALDISLLNASGGTLAQYASLSAALAAIPESLQRGGMEIKYVQTSDNNYVQFRCIADEFTTDVTKWQGVDAEPTAGSNNLVKSGSVYPIKIQAAETQSKLPASYNKLSYSTVANKRLGQDTAGNVVYIDADGETVVEFDVIEGRTLTFYPGVNFGSSGLFRALWCQNNKVIETIENWTTIEQTGMWNVVVPNGCNKFRAGTGTSTLDNVEVYMEGFDNVPSDTMIEHCLMKSISISNAILTDGKSLNVDTGVVTDDPYSFMSTWINISGHLDNSYLYMMTWFSNTFGISFYDKNKQRISGISGNNARENGLLIMTVAYQAVPIPENAVYIIFSASLNRKSLFLGTEIRFADYSELLAVRSYYPALYGSYFKGVPFFMNANCMELNALYFNSLTFNQKLFDSRCRVPSNFSHDSTLVISEQGKAYIVACCNENGSGDNPYYSDAYVALFSCDAATYTPSTTMSKKVVAKNGDSVGSLTIALGAGVPNVRIISSTTLRIILSAKLSDNNWYLLYRDYDISNDSFGDIGVCQIEDENNVSHDFTIDYINDNITELQNQDVFISLNGTIGYDGTTYYCGMCAINQIASSLIFASNDLITFKLWLKPSFANQCLANCEASSFVEGSTLFYAVRQYEGNVMLLAKINMTNKSITEELVIPDAMARPCFYSDGSVLYLAHSMDNRNYTDFVVINKDSLINSHIVLQTAIQTAYPCCVKFGNNIYMTATSNGYVYLRKFDNNRDSINVVNGKMMSLYNYINIERAL